MKKIGLLVVAVSLSLSLAAFAAETSASNQGKSPSSQTDGAKGKGKGKARVDPATQQKMLNEQLTTLKQEHQATVTELQGIKQLATDEGAKKTAAALGTLIAKHEQEYQKKIEPLQQALKKLEAAKKDAAEKKAPEKTKTSK
jgi:hypothetical protein